jgi:phospholipase/carboxylesterase
MSEPDLETVVVDPPGAHRWTVVWLHGLGADGHDFEPIVPELRLPRDHGVRFVFPHAPVRPVTLNGRMEMRAWYDLASVDLAADEDEAGIRASAGAIDRLLRAECARGVAASRVVLAGFSQGAAIALHAGLRQPEALAGIVALSGYLPLADRLAAEITDAGRDLPIFQGHGEQDPVVPLALAEATRERVARVRAAPVWRAYPMAHGVCAEEIADLRRWLLDHVGIGGN